MKEEENQRMKSLNENAEKLDKELAQVLEQKKLNEI